MPETAVRESTYMIVSGSGKRALGLAVCGSMMSGWVDFRIKKLDEERVELTKILVDEVSRVELRSGELDKAWRFRGRTGSFLFNEGVCWIEGVYRPYQRVGNRGWIKFKS